MKIKELFEKKRPLFLPFIVAGHPDMETSTQAILELSESGADIIELGIPFSDPIADGPINQLASEKALKSGTTIPLILKQIENIRMRGCETPIVLFSYLNPIIAYGVKQIAKDAKQAGVNGMLIVDLPPEEGEELYSCLTRAGLEIALFASPTTDRARLQHYKKLAPSFIYYISRLGVTGTRQGLPEDLRKNIQSLRSSMGPIPIATGFGISTPEQAAEVAKISDGIIVGSKLVKTLEREGLTGLNNYARSLSNAIINTPHRRYV
jgi:tryptophan synthase alpha subunit